MLLFIYNADGTVIGELKYLWDKVFHQKQCELCTLSHQGIRARKDWLQFLKSLDQPYQVLHTNELDQETKEFVASRLPCIIWRSSESEFSKFHYLIGKGDWLSINTVSDLQKELEERIQKIRLNK